MSSESARSEGSWTAFEAALQGALPALGLDLDADVCGRLFEHYQQVVEANRSFNLTRITGPADAAVKHYADSLSLLASPWVDAERSTVVLDVGTGAGFPAAPLAIVCPRWSVLAIDGTAKKVRFVQACAEAMGLGNLEGRHARGTDFARENQRKRGRDSAGRRHTHSSDSNPAVRSGGAGVVGQRDQTVDLILMRAVSRLEAGLREVAPLLTGGAAAVFYKTAGIRVDELEAGRKEARSLRLDESTFDLTLPAADGPLHRRLVRYARARHATT
jgi:16S rRNA G527 N7-methylase RsmG